MKINKRKDYHRITLLIIVILSTYVTAEKQKRQIFREQVLPALGGKIPEEAFRTDRLALNRLNKEGITVPDGVILDARHIHKHPHSDQRMPEVLKIYLTSDGRYVSPEGQFRYNQPKTVDTTYIIRRPYMHENNHKSSIGNVKLHNYVKPQAYSNYRRFLPIVPPVKPGVYKAFVTPLIFPTDRNLFGLSSLNAEYDWDVYEPFDDYFVDNIALFNSHQIITDYQGFLNEFHERSLRHVDPKNDNIDQQHHQERKYQKLKQSSHQSIESNVANSHNSAYTSLTSIPATNFSCRGRKGIFADVETNCQVFHNCSGWSRTSALCPPGTAFCEENKRCEWFNTVQCKD